MRSIVALGDCHVPYQHKKSVRWALSFIKEHKVSHLVLLGDIIDFYSISRFERDPEKRNLDREVNATKDFIGSIDDLGIPTTYIIGNHEFRYQKYLWNNAVELTTILPLYKLINIPRRWKIVEYNQQITYNGVMYFHGQRCGPGLFSKNLNIGISSVQGHSHLLGCHSRRLADNKIITAASAGCLCEYDVDYSTYPDWQRGLIYIEGTQITPIRCPF